MSKHEEIKRLRKKIKDLKKEISEATCGEDYMEASYELMYAMSDINRILGHKFNYTKII